VTVYRKQFQGRVSCPERTALHHFGKKKLSLLSRTGNIIRLFLSLL